MRNKRRWMAVLLVAVGAVVMVGSLTASNMGFKLNYALIGGAATTSNSGTQTIGLPYNRQVGIDFASELLDDVDLSVTTQTLTKYIIADDSALIYPLGTNPDFALESGVGYLLKVDAAANGDYIIVGSHDPSLALTLVPGSDPASNSGTSLYAHPYHGVSDSASELLAELGANAQQIQDYQIVDDSVLIYPLGTNPDFTLVPGKAYLVKIGGASNIVFTPAHY